MRKLIRYFIENTIYANAIIIITAIAGILSLSIMPKSFFPEMSPNKVYVNVSYPGASPEEIEEGRVRQFVLFFDDSFSSHHRVTWISNTHRSTYYH